MSNFFGDINSVRFPEVVMNQGPLPSPGGLPAPLHDTPDGRINYNSTLLGNVVPYAYGQAGYISSDTSYVNFPHSIQKIVPELYFPIGEEDTQSLFPLSHAVDDSDIAFVMRLARTSSLCPILSKRAFDRQRVNMTVEPFINLCTLNYILAGLQLCLTANSPNPNLWFELLHDLDRERWPERDSVDLDVNDLVHIVQNLIKPFGVVRGSEKQGGQDQVGYAPATWPVCFITNMVLDGKERNVNNIWTHMELPAGTDLVIRLKACEIPRQYTLNHYYKYVTKQPIKVNSANLDNGTTHVWQLVPDTFNLDYHPVRMWPTDKVFPVGFDPSMSRNRTSGVRSQAFGSNAPSWQDLGYWHIGRTQVQMGKLSPELYYNNDLHLQMRPPHLEMTFQPVWYNTPRATGQITSVGVSSHGPPAPPPGKPPSGSMKARRHLPPSDADYELQVLNEFMPIINLVDDEELEIEAQPADVRIQGLPAVRREVRAVAPGPPPPRGPPGGGAVRIRAEVIRPFIPELIREPFPAPEIPAENPVVRPVETPFTPVFNTPWPEGETPPWVPFPCFPLNTWQDGRLVQRFIKVVVDPAVDPEGGEADGEMESGEQMDDQEAMRAELEWTSAPSAAPYSMLGDLTGVGGFTEGGDMDVGGLTEAVDMDVGVLTGAEGGVDMVMQEGSGGSGLPLPQASPMREEAEEPSTGAASGGARKRAKKTAGAGNGVV